MKEKATIYDLWSLCSTFKECDDCPLIQEDCGLNYGSTIKDIDRMNEIILKWCKEHPVKTRQDKLLEMFPNAIKDNGIIDICPAAVDKEYSEDSCNGECCADCRKSYWLAEVEE